jgi:hypothetical protein
MKAAGEQSRINSGEFVSLRNLKAKDVENLKAGLASSAQSKRVFFEAGLALQEEKRLLEKQQEIMITWVRVDPQERKIVILRGELPIQQFDLGYSSPAALGGEKRALPASCQIVSKERFAHPERGKLEEKDGVLQWIPPQVGTSVRSNALGEFVVFTNGPLILHGPPKKQAEHDSFPHVCLGLTLRGAKQLYQDTFIGTRVTLKKNETPARPR